MQLRLTSLSVGMIVLFTTLVPASLSAHGARVRVVVPHRHHHRHAHAVGFYAPGRRVVRVQRVNYGTVDFNVRPQHSRVYVDGDYLGIADDFNGYPQKARLPAGYHSVRVVSPAGRVEVRRIYVAAGRELNFNLEF